MMEKGRGKVKKRVLIDLDDTIVEKGFLRMVNEFLGTNYKGEDAETSYVNSLIPDEKMEEWIEFFTKNDLYERADLIKDAKEVLEKLTQKYDVYILSACIFVEDPDSSAILAYNKFNYIIKEFPFIGAKNIILACNKEMIQGDIRIDDNYSHLKGDAETKILFSAYHNKMISDEELKKDNIIRVESWEEIEKILLG